MMHAAYVNCEKELGTRIYHRPLVHIEFARPSSEVKKASPIDTLMHCCSYILAEATSLLDTSFKMSFLL